MPNKKNYKNPDSIIASELSKKAIKYRHTTNERERNKLFMEIAEHYMPKINKQLQTVHECNKSEFMQIYYMQIVSALNNWKQNSNFETYLYLYVKGVLPRFMNNIKSFKKDIDYCYISELEDDGDVQLTYEMLDEFYDNNNIDEDVDYEDGYFINF